MMAGVLGARGTCMGGGDSKLGVVISDMDRPRRSRPPAGAVRGGKQGD